MQEMSFYLRRSAGVPITIVSALLLYRLGVSTTVGWVYLPIVTRSMEAASIKA